MPGGSRARSTWTTGSCSRRLTLKLKMPELRKKAGESIGELVSLFVAVSVCECVCPPLQNAAAITAAALAHGLLGTGMMVMRIIVDHFI